MITNRVQHSCYYSLSDYFLENRSFYNHSKRYQPNIESLHIQVLQESHDQLMSGHPGIAKIYKIFQRSYYWPKMMETIYQYIRNCHICTIAKPARNRQRKPLPFPIPQRPWIDLTIDLITELPVSSDAWYLHLCHICIITARLTKKRHFVPY